MEANEAPDEETKMTDNKIEAGDIIEKLDSHYGEWEEFGTVKAHEIRFAEELVNNRGGRFRVVRVSMGERRVIA